MNQPSQRYEETDDGPTVTVVVPAKDGGEFIRPCLRSIREQWYPSLECVVVNDGSTDDTLSIAEEFADKHERFRVVSHATTRGPSAARNTGLANSSAPFVTFLDADDFLYPHSIRGRVEALLAADSEIVAGTYCDWQTTPQNEGPKPPEREPATKEELVGFAHGPECPFIVTAPMVRRSVLQQVGGFDEAMPTAEDFDLWIRVLREGYTFSYVPLIGVAYRQKSSGLVFSESAQHAEASMEVIEQQYNDLSGNVDAPELSRPLPYYQLQSARARRLLRTYALASAMNEVDDARRIERLLSADLDSLVRAGLNVEGELRAGAWRASRAIPELRDNKERAEFVHGLATQLWTRPGLGDAEWVHEI